MQFFADQAYDEVVVVAVEPMTGKPHVVSVVGGAEGDADGAVLGEDGALFVRRELRESTVTPNGYQTAQRQAGLSTVRRGRCRSTSARSGS